MLDDEVVIRLLDHGAVRSADGRPLGRVGQLFRSDSDGEATWVSIDDGGPDGMQTLVPMAGSTVHGNDLQVAYPADAVVGAPQVAVGAAVSGDDEQRVREFYAAADPAGAGVAVDAEGAADGGPAADDRPAEGDTAAAVDPVTGDESPPATDGEVAVDRSAAVTRDDSAPATDVLSVVRSEEELSVGTQWVPVRRARLEKFQATETRTIEVEWTREDVRVVYDALEDGGQAAPGSGTPARPWVLMEERIVVTKEWVPAQTVRLVVDRVTGEQIVSEPVRKEQVDVEAIEPDGVGDNHPPLDR